ncbi:MAG: UDP-N-acetylmuramate--L-alanine ligase [Candidatus Omnitrophica bacterium]|jgi:UDP-N-acetylmuramate--alanine ligase|nr:UDP-N-acetylmuramate--L-alanine ligase [Candidatus Omnitrophota bacterium]
MNRHVHFIGIGGIGMSGIAKLFITRGAARVSGSDVKETSLISLLRSKGADIFIGHAKENLGDADLVVYSSAIAEDNPELAEARRSSRRVIKRAQALAELMREQKVITVTGAHGKTTTASLISCLLMEAKMCPSVVIGGILNNIQDNACHGDGGFFVAEADESDGSFLYYNPLYSVITNLDDEHMDYYRDFNYLKRCFSDFIDKTAVGGCVFACGDDSNLRQILSKYTEDFLFFGLGKDNHIYASNIKMDGLSSEFDCIYKNKNIGRFKLSLGGKHNISNSLSVVALGLKLGINKSIISSALQGYKGSGRRIQVKYQDSRCALIDDYAHHPTEIKATLSAVNNLKYKRMVVIFQPHRYSRTQRLFDEFTKCFSGADVLIITDIYPASEKPIPGVDAQNLALAIAKAMPGSRVCFTPKDKIKEHVIDGLNKEDLILTLGAGDITRISDEIAEELSKQNKNKT